MTYPLITVVMTTWFPEGSHRAEVASSTLASWAQNLRYYNGSMALHVADDGTPDLELPEFIVGEVFKKQPVTRSQQQRHGVGASLNAGFGKAFERSPLVLYAVDDWALTQPFDITPWAQLLMECEDVGMVRLGPPHPQISGHVEIFTNNWQGWALRLDRAGYAFGHRPALYHKRMIDYYGWFAEDCDALVCEKKYNAKFCQDLGGPDVVLALPHPWQHLDSVELAYVDPTKE
jgi:hypothetical protein